MRLSLPRSSPAPPSSLFQSHARSPAAAARSHTCLPHPSRSPPAGRFPATAAARAFTTLPRTMAPTTASGADLAAILSKNRPIVISGPSGAGKSTILKRLFAEYPDRFGFSVSHTTRSPRGGEQHGTDYNFITKDEFLKLIEDKGFVEHAQFGGNHYGTSTAAIQDIASKGRICILDIEMEGVKQVANHPTFPQPRFLFLSPPSLDILEQRLRARQTDSEDAIQKRLKQAKVEMEFAHSGEAPHEKIVVNDDLEKAYQEVKDFIVGKDA